MSRAALAAPEMLVPAANALPAYLDVAANARPPCTDEFTALMRCLTTSRNAASCVDKYVLLKGCLRAHGLPLAE